MPARRQDAFVQGRFRPACVSLEVGELLAFALDEVVDLVGAVGARFDAVVLCGEAEGQARGLIDRVAEGGAQAKTVDGVIGHAVIVVFVVVGLAVERVVTQAHAVGGEVGVGETDVVLALVGRTGQPQAGVVTGTEKVVLGNRAAKDQA